MGARCPKEEPRQPQQAMGTALERTRKHPYGGDADGRGTNNRMAQLPETCSRWDTAEEEGGFSSLFQVVAEGRPLPPSGTQASQCVLPPRERCHLGTENGFSHYHNGMLSSCPFCASNSAPEILEVSNIIQVFPFWPAQ